MEGGTHRSRPSSVSCGNDVGSCVTSTFVTFRVDPASVPGSCESSRAAKLCTIISNILDLRASFSALLERISVMAAMKAFSLSIMRENGSRGTTSSKVDDSDVDEMFAPD